VHEVLRSAVLTIVSDNPGVKAKAVVALLPKTYFRRDILMCVRDLHREGLLSVNRCRHRVVEPIEPAPPAELPGTRYLSSGFIAPIPKCRLMSGR